MIDVKKHVDDAETVVRLLSFPGCIADGHLTPEAFSLYHKNEDYVSVLRRLFVANTEELFVLGRRIKRWPVKNARFSGYCSLGVAAVRLLSKRLDVISCYEEKFKSHAGIVFYDGAGMRIKNNEDEVFPPDLHLLQLKLCSIADDLVLV